MADVTLKAKVDMQEIDEAIEKASRLVELLREASSLASSLGGRSLIDPMEGFNQSLEKAFQEEASRFQMKDTGLFQSGEHDADSCL